MVRRVHREQLVALGGGRTLLMQATHPVAFAGFFAHTGALDEPYERLQPHRAGHGPDRLRPAGAGGARDAARARDAPPGPRRPGRAGGPLRRPGRRTPPTTRRCCSGSWPASPTPRCWPTSATSPACRTASATATGRTTGSSAGSSASPATRCPPTTRAFASTWTAWSRATRCTSRPRPASWRCRSSCARRSPAGPPAARALQLRDGRPAAGPAAPRVRLLVGPGARDRAAHGRGVHAPGRPAAAAAPRAARVERAPGEAA